MFEEIFSADIAAPDARSMQGAIAVYRKGNELVIRQRRPLSDEEPCIVVSLEDAEDLIQSIRQEMLSGK